MLKLPKGYRFTNYINVCPANFEFCLNLNKKNQKRHEVLFREWLYRHNKDNNKIWRCLHWFFIVNENVY